MGILYDTVKNQERKRITATCPMTGETIRDGMYVRDESSVFTKEQFDYLKNRNRNTENK